MEARMTISSIALWVLASSISSATGYTWAILLPVLLLDFCINPPSRPCGCRG
jgi:hypothetical protein